jgi:hypothetical protein
MAFIKVNDSVRDRLNKIAWKLKEKNPELKNSITQSYVIHLALNELEAKK